MPNSRSGWARYVVVYSTGLEVDVRVVLRLRPNFEEIIDFDPLGAAKRGLGAFTGAFGTGGDTQFARGTAPPGCGSQVCPLAGVGLRSSAGGFRTWPLAAGLGFLPSEGRGVVSG